MSKKMLFKVFCLESYKSAHNLSGASVATSFAKNGVFDYLDSFYDVLHSTGQQYIVADIDQFLMNRQRTSGLSLQ